MAVLSLTVGVTRAEQADEKTDAGGQWKYVTEDSSATITGLADEDFEGFITIPDELDGYPVTCISAYAFADSWIIGVTIPEGVTHIGDHAFCACWDLGSALIPDSVTSIGEDAFAACRNLVFIVTSYGGTISCGDVQLIPLDTEELELRYNRPIPAGRTSRFKET